MQELFQMATPGNDDGQIHCTGVNKGGGTKTTLTINEGVMLTLLGASVLVVDAAPEAHTTYSYGYWPEHIRYSLYDLLTGSCTLNEAIVPTYYNTSTKTFFCPIERVDSDDPQSKTLLEVANDDGVKVLRGPDLLPMKLAIGTEGGTKPDDLLRGRDLRELLLAIALHPARKIYQYILIDTNPDLLNILTVNALYAADWVDIPFIPEQLTVIGFKNMLDAIKRAQQTINRKLRISGVLFSKVKEVRAHWDVMEPFKKITEAQGIYIFQTMIREKAKNFLEASNKHSVVVLDDPLSDSALEFWGYLIELLAITGGPAQKQSLPTLQSLLTQRKQADEQREQKRQTKENQDAHKKKQTDSSRKKITT
jgi:chromosome partitioning protein